MQAEAAGQCAICRSSNRERIEWIYCPPTQLHKWIEPSHFGNWILPNFFRYEHNLRGQTNKRLALWYSTSILSQARERMFTNERIDYIKRIKQVIPSITSLQTLCYNFESEMNVLCQYLGTVILWRFVCDKPWWDISASILYCHGWQKSIETSHSLKLV